MEIDALVLHFYNVSLTNFVPCCTFKRNCKIDLSIDFVFVRFPLSLVVYVVVFSVCWFVLIVFLNSGGS